MEVLFLYDNPITTLPETIGNLTNLKELNLAQWLEPGITELPDAIGNLVKSIASGKKDETLNPLIKNLPLSEHILKERILHGEVRPKIYEHNSSSSWRI